jgi:hypothetical protein
MSMTARKANSLFKRAHHGAIKDRESYFHAVTSDEDKKEVQETLDLIHRVKDKKVSELSSEEEVKGLYYTLLYAEQWDDSLADSLGESDPQFTKNLKKNAKEYKELRHLLFGKNKLELMLENAKSVTLDEIKQIKKDSNVNKTKTLKM